MSCSPNLLARLLTAIVRLVRYPVEKDGSGGRGWWAHFAFTRINIEPIILHKKIEERRVVGAFRTLIYSLGSSAPRHAA